MLTISTYIIKWVDSFRNLNYIKNFKESWFNIMAKKITKREIVTAMLEELNSKGTISKTEERIEFLEKFLESLEKKSSVNSKKAKENDGIKELILTTLELNATDEGMTVTEINKCDGLEDFSNQKLSALLRQMIEEKTVVKVVKGRTAKFKIA